MNKKFSTLLVSALLASGTAFTAQAEETVTPYVPGSAGINTRLNAYVKVGSEYLAVNEKGEIVAIANVNTGSKLVSALWSVKANKVSSAFGDNYTWSLINNSTGQTLSVKLSTDKGNEEGVRKVKTFEKDGNTAWVWSTAGLSIVKGDSTYVLGYDATAKTLKLVNKIQAGDVAGALTAITHAPIPVQVPGGAAAANASMKLTAADFTALVKTGKLYFNNGKEVSKNNSNVLTDNTWTAEQAYLKNDGFVNPLAGGEPVLFFSSDKKVNGKKQYLLVDQEQYDANINALHKLSADSLAFEVPALESWYKHDKDGDLVLDGEGDPVEITGTDLSNALKKVDADAIAKGSIKGQYHPFAGAFQATYYIANDSIVLKALYEPDKITVDATIGKLIDNMDLANSKNFKNVPALDALVGAINDFLDDAAIDDKFVDFVVGEKTGKKLIEAASKAIGDVKAPEGEKDNAVYKAEKALVDSFMDGIVDLVRSKDVDDEKAFATKKYPAAAFTDGLNGLKVSELDEENNQVILRTLVGTTVLTLGKIGDDKANIAPLIQPYKNKQTIGGDAVIAEGIYYIKNMKTVAEDGKKNAYYGKYYDAAGWNATGYVNEAQAFNPFAQFVVTKAAGADKGNYVFTVLGSGEDSGNTIVMKAGDNYVIDGDTIALEAAGKVADVDKYLGSAHFTAAELKNNTFVVASASAALKGETFAMLEDSTVTLAADEVAFKLIPGAEVKEQGYDKKLAYVPYAIMTEDSLAIAKVNGKYVFTTQKAGKKVAGVSPVYFRLVATGSASTYVLYDNNATTSVSDEEAEAGITPEDDDVKVGVNVQTKTIIPADLDALNDLFTVTAVEAPASYKTTGETAKIQVANGFLAINNDNQAMSVREGDLRAAYTADDFVFTLDTAKYEGAETYTYFISKEVADTKLIMWEATDSLKAEKNAPYLSGLDTRVLFRPLNKIDNDTVYVANLSDLAKEDTAKNSASYQFSFAQVSDDAADGYIMQSGDKYVAVANGVVVVTTDKENAATVQIETVEGPTANEAVAAAEVSVVGANGAIIVKGAAGKVVTVANILGQTIANQVAVSDNVTIAAPAGIAVVTVDGEATKVVVK